MEYTIEVLVWRTTEKAVLLSPKVRGQVKQDYKDDDKTWLPKSRINNWYLIKDYFPVPNRDENGVSMTIEVDEWIAEEL